MSFGDRLATTRKARGYTQEALARAAGVGLQVIRRVECGRTQTPHGDVIVRLAKSLGVSTDYLLGMYEDKAIENRGSNNT